MARIAVAALLLLGLAALALAPTASASAPCVWFREGIEQIDVQPDVPSVTFIGVGPGHFGILAIGTWYVSLAPDC